MDKFRQADSYIGYCSGKLAFTGSILYNYPFAGRKHERFAASELRMGLSELLLQQKVMLDADGELARQRHIKLKCLFA